MHGRTYFVYILASRTRVLYTGVTNDLRRRVIEHQERNGGTFTGRYGVNQLVYYERFDDARTAISREKEIKGWRRDKRTWLIEGFNPAWKDLSKLLWGPLGG